MRELGTLAMTVGAVLVVVGIVLRFAPWLVGWFGHLPGDVRIESDEGFLFVPFTSMIVVSVLLSLLLAVLSHLRG